MLFDDVVLAAAAHADCHTLTVSLLAVLAATVYTDCQKLTMSLLAVLAAAVHTDGQMLTVSLLANSGSLLQRLTRLTLIWM